jgi:c-di-GMP-related signal transduction protein
MKRSYLLSDNFLSFSEKRIVLEVLEKLIIDDVSLSYRLLRVVNSAFFALPRKVDCIRNAVTYLGLETTRNLATLLTLSCIEDKPVELIKSAMIRAKFCEKLGALTGMPHREIYYTVGLFSTLDALIECSNGNDTKWVAPECGHYRRPSVWRGVSRRNPEESYRLRAR